MCFYTNTLCLNSFLLSSEQSCVLSLSQHGEVQRWSNSRSLSQSGHGNGRGLRVCGNLGSFGRFPTMGFGAEGILLCSSWKTKLQQKKEFLIIKYTRFTLFVSKYEVKSLIHIRLFATRWTVAYQASLSMGFSRQEYWSGLPFPSAGDLPDSGIEPRSPSLQADALPSEPPGKP